MSVLAAILEERVDGGRGKLADKNRKPCSSIRTSNALRTPAMGSAHQRWYQQRVITPIQI